MASPASLSDSAVVDPNRQGRFTLQLSDDILSTANDNTQDKLISVRLNQHPDLPSRSISNLKTNQSNTSASLTISHSTSSSSPQQFIYKGEHGSVNNSYVLVFDPTTHTATINPIKDSFALNLSSAPQSIVQDPQSLKQIHLPTSISSTQSSVPLDALPEANNPFDFRHYLNKKSSARSPSPNPAPALVSGAKSANANSKDRSAAATAAAATPNTTSKNSKGGAAKQQPTPVIRLDRRASTRPSEENKPKAAPQKKKLTAKKLGMVPRKVLSKETIDSADEASDNDDEHLLKPSPPVPKPAAPKSKPKPAPKPKPKTKTQAQALALPTKPASPPSPTSHPKSHNLSSDEEDSDSDNDGLANSNPLGGGGGGGGIVSGLEIILGSDDEQAEAATKQKSRPRANTGPISLRSAANSPLSSVGTPRGALLSRSFDIPEGLEEADEDDEDDDEEEEEEIEDDVEPLVLDAGRNDNRQVSVKDDQDLDMDDFEAELERGLMGESEESEAE